MNSASLGGGREPDEGVQLIDDEVESKGQAKSAVMMLSDNSLISVGGNVKEVSLLHFKYRETRRLTSVAIKSIVDSIHLMLTRSAR